MKHTKEPWEADGYGAMNRITDGHETIGYTDPIIRARSKQEDVAEGEANARRIVACVNACAGITNEALEAGVVACGVNNLRDNIPEGNDQFYFDNVKVFEEDV